MSELHDYCKNHSIKLKVLPDGIEVRYTMKHGTSHFNEFSQKLLKHLRKIRRITSYDYVPSHHSFNYRDWPVVKVKGTFRVPK
jgi:hypothetical protein